jgi:hypothetical protein
MQAENVAHDQLQTAVSHLIEKSISAIDRGVSFFSEQIPDVIQQLLYWKVTESLSYCVFGVLLFCFMLFLDYRIFIAVKKTEDDEVLVLGWGMLGSLVRIAYIIPIHMINFTWLQIWITPKVFLLEYAHTFLSK